MVTFFPWVWYYELKYIVYNGCVDVSEIFIEKIKKY